MTEKYKRPALKQETWEALEEFMADGQTPDGAIKELLNMHGVTVEVEA